MDELGFQACLIHFMGCVIHKWQQWFSCNLLYVGGHNPESSGLVAFHHQYEFGFAKNLQLFFVNMTWHPLLQSCLMDMSDEWARLGTTWAKVAESLRLGRSRLLTWVEWITSPLGNVIFKGFSAFLLLEMFTWGMSK